MTAAMAIRCTILLFGPLAEAAGRREAQVVLPEGSIVADLWPALSAALPEAAAEFERWRGRTAHARDHRYVASHQALVDGDVIALVPPVSGG